MQIKQEKVWGKQGSNKEAIRGMFGKEKGSMIGRRSRGVEHQWC